MTSSSSAANNAVILDLISKQGLPHDVHRTTLPKHEASRGSRTGRQDEEPRGGKASNARCTPLALRGQAKFRHGSGRLGWAAELQTALREKCPCCEHVLTLGDLVTWCAVHFPPPLSPWGEWRDRTPHAARPVVAAAACRLHPSEGCWSTALPRALQNLFQQLPCGATFSDVRLGLWAYGPRPPALFYSLKAFLSLREELESACEPVLCGLCGARLPGLVWGVAWAPGPGLDLTRRKEHRRCNVCTSLSKTKRETESHREPKKRAQSQRHCGLTLRSSGLVGALGLRGEEEAALRGAARPRAGPSLARLSHSAARAQRFSR